MPSRKSKLLRCLRLKTHTCNPRDWRHIPLATEYGLKGYIKMLWTIFVILLVLWLLGWIGFHALGAYIHIVLLLALIVLVIQLVSGRRAV